MGKFFFYSEIVQLNRSLFREGHKEDGGLLYDIQSPTRWFSNTSTFLFAILHPPTPLDSIGAADFCEEIMTTRDYIKLVNEREYVAEVDIELIETETSWSPYLSI